LEDEVSITNPVFLNDLTYLVQSSEFRVSEKEREKGKGKS
jgi:hypothetical protein